MELNNQEMNLLLEKLKTDSLELRNTPFIKWEDRCLYIFRCFYNQSERLKKTMR